MILDSTDVQFTMEGVLLHVWVIIRAIQRDLPTQNRQPGCRQLYQDLTDIDRNWAEKVKSEFRKRPDAGRRKIPEAGGLMELTIWIVQTIPGQQAALTPQGQARHRTGEGRIKTPELGKHGLTPALDRKKPRLGIL